MAAYDAFDPRIDALVIEKKTDWDPAIGTLSDTDKSWLALAVHAAPAQAAMIHYERMHTGFCREITVTVADVERIYREKVAAG